MDPSALCNYLSEACRKASQRCRLEAGEAAATSWNTGSSSWKEGKIKMTVVKYWNSLPREAVGTPSLEIITPQRHKTLSTLLYWTWYEQ